MGFCAVCGKEVGPDAARIGGREFCDPHFNRALGSRKSVLWGSLAGVLAACLASFLGALLGRFGLDRAPAPLTVALAAFLAILPPALWLLIFYRMDSLEPEPPAMVTGAFALGALLAGALGIPLLEGVLPRPFAFLPGSASAFLDAIIFVGLGQELLKYAGLRAAILMREEFDERIDGIVYGAAIGLGYATMSNLRLALGTSGLSLEVAGFESAISCLAQASSGGLCGYFAAKAKFDGKAGLFIGLGIGLASLLNGAEGSLLSLAARQSMAYLPWRPLLVAGLVALACFGGLFALAWTENGRAIASSAKGARA
jgi:RsiW-degrading membrane proteinase PrsW (M82 family)